VNAITKLMDLDLVSNQAQPELRDRRRDGQVVWDGKYLSL
jgi:hypothetical protein